MSASEKMVDIPSTQLNTAVHGKVVDSIEYWRTNDILEIIKPLIGSELAGLARQIKRHRDWLAHKNPKKPSPGNVPPTVAFQVLSEITQILSTHQPKAEDGRVVRPQRSC